MPRRAGQPGRHHWGDVLHPIELGRRCLDEGGYAVGERRQPRVVRPAVDEVPDVEIEPTERLVLDLHTLHGHEGRHFLWHLGRDEDPAVALDLDQPLPEPSSRIRSR